MPSRVEPLRLRSAGEPRAAVFAAVDLDGCTVTAVSTHLQNRRAGRPDEAPDQLDEVLAALVGWPEPWVLMGDLNLRPEAVLPRLDRAGMVAVPASPTYLSDRPRLRIDSTAVRRLEGARSWEVPELPGDDPSPPRWPISRRSRLEPHRRRRDRRTARSRASRGRIASVVALATRWTGPDRRSAQSRRAGADGELHSRTAGSMRSW